MIGLREYSHHSKIKYEYSHCKRCYRTDGKPCYRWTCRNRKCRVARRNSEAARMFKGVDEMKKHRLPIYFMAIMLQDENKTTFEQYEIHDFCDHSNKLLGQLQRWAKKAGAILLRVRVFDIKSSNANAPNQLHAHVICSWIPDPVHLHGSVFRSKKLEKSAQYYGLKVHIEQARYPKAVVRYLAKKFKKFTNIKLPSYFQRISYSRNWAKLDYQLRRKFHQRVKQHIQHLEPQHNLLLLNVARIETRVVTELDSEIRQQFTDSRFNFTTLLCLVPNPEQYITMSNIDLWLIILHRTKKNNKSPPKLEIIFPDNYINITDYNILAFRNNGRWILLFMLLFFIAQWLSDIL